MRLRNYPKGPVQTAKQIESNDVPQRKYSVGYTDFLPLFVGPAVIADRNFIDDHLQLGDLRSHFDFNTESAGLDDHAPNDIAAESFVAGLDVSHVQVRQEI